jgi:hypothetical protein
MLRGCAHGRLAMTEAVSGLGEPLLIFFFFFFFFFFRRGRGDLFVRRTNRHAHLYSSGILAKGSRSGDA